MRHEFGSAGMARVYLETAPLVDRTKPPESTADFRPQRAVAELAMMSRLKSRLG